MNSFRGAKRWCSLRSVCRDLYPYIISYTRCKWFGSLPIICVLLAVLLVISNALAELMHLDVNELVKTWEAHDVHTGPHFSSVDELSGGELRRCMWCASVDTQKLLKACTNVALFLQDSLDVLLKRSVEALNLTIGLWMVYCRPMVGNPSGLQELLEYAGFKLWAMIRNNHLRIPFPAEDSNEEFTYSFSRNLVTKSYLWPLSEVVD